MERRDATATERNGRRGSATALIVVGLSLLLLVFASCERRSVETVTVAAQQRSSAADGKPLISTAQLPARDLNLEAAGDRIAEARIDLKRKNTGAALRAISVAEEDVKKAAVIQPGDAHLAALIRRLQTVEQELQHRDLKVAASELRKLSQELNR